MRILKQVCRGLLTASALSLGVHAWGAPIVSATAEAELEGTNVASASDTDATAAYASVADSSNFPEWHAAGASDSDGRLAATAEFLGASSTFSRITASASWTDTFDAAAGSTGIFDFVIPEAAIGFQANNVRGLSGEISVEISLNGVVLFSTLARVTTTGSTPTTPGDLILTQSGTDLLTPTFATDVAPLITSGWTGGGLRFASFSSSLLFDLLAGSNTLTYSMTAWVDGLIGETAATASIGDPLKLSVQPPGASLVINGGPQPVPEPGTLGLLGAGLLGLTLVRRKHAA